MPTHCFNFRKLSAICFLVIFVTGKPSFGEDDPKIYTASDVNTLIKRLDQAESRIADFESELTELKNKPVPEQSETDLVQEISFEETKDPDSLVDSVIKDYDTKWAEQEKFNKELEESLEGFVVPGTKLNTMVVNGRIHLDYWAFPGSSPGANVFETRNPRNSPNDRIGFRRLRFGVKGDIWKNMDYKIEMEFAGGDETEFRDAYISFKKLPILQTLRFGNQKRPYGLDHLNSSRYNVFLERPFIIESFNQDARRLGIQSWGHSEDLEYNWRYGVFNQRLVQDEGYYVSDHVQGEIAGRFAHTFWYDHSDGSNYAHWAVSGTFAHPDGSTPLDTANIGRDSNEARFRHRPEARSTSRWLDTGRIAYADWYELLGLEGVVNVGPFQLVGEYQQMWLQRESDFGPNLQFGGTYAYISYFLTGEHIPWDRKTGTLGRVKPKKNFFLFKNNCCGVDKGWGAWQIALRYSYADLTDDNIFGGVGENITFGLNWHWNPNARMQFNYIYGDITDRRVTALNGLVYTGGDYHILGVRMMVDF